MHPGLKAGGARPYRTDRLLLKSSAPLLSAEDCQALIAQMEAHGAAHGWDARYPVSGFTREVTESARACSYYSIQIHRHCNNSFTFLAVQFLVVNQRLYECFKHV